MQKYAIEKKPFKTAINADSLWQCCVRKDGKRKKSYSDQREAVKIAILKELEIYECMFIPNTYHLTTQEQKVTRRNKNKLSIKGRIDRLLKHLVMTELELEGLIAELDAMTSETPLVEIRMLEARWKSLKNNQKQQEEALELFQQKLKNKNERKSND